MTITRIDRWDWLWLGDRGLLESSFVALLASTRTAADLVLPTLDTVAAGAKDGIIFVSGFHSPLEREALDILFRAGATVVVCPALPLDVGRMPRPWRVRLDAGRLAVACPLQQRAPRVTVQLAIRRTQTVVALARHLFVPAARPGSRTYAAVRDAFAAGKRISCMDHPSNADLRLLGARPLPLRSPRLDPPDLRHVQSR